MPPVHGRYAIALLTAAIGGIFNSSGDLFPAFGVASSTYINETRVKQPLVLVKKIVFNLVLMRAQNF
ncbi:MAG: hypothetical protein V7L31_29725 [Nostoc sp.]|uniref:hypothetical protein n=1 Tax=Nostoc sp. TaxID=1180 RepID=UPI002FF34BCF